MQKKKIATKISAGILAAFIVIQGMFPTVAVFADEISDTDETSPVIEEVVIEPSETEETEIAEDIDSDETEATEETEPSVEETETTETEETVPEETETETTEPSVEETESTVEITDAVDSEAFGNAVASLSAAKLSKDFWYLLPQIATIYYAGKHGLKVITDSDDPVGIPITAFVPDIGLAIDVCCSSKVVSVKEYICGINDITYVCIPGQLPEIETITIIRQAFSDAHLYFDSSIERDLEILRVNYIHWKKKNS